MGAPGTRKHLVKTVPDRLEPPQELTGYLTEGRIVGSLPGGGLAVYRRDVFAVAATVLVLLGFPTSAVATTVSVSKRYVALGDSYASGPGIPVQRADPVGCQRSTHNYPARLAAALGIGDYIDVSCGGARTDNMLVSQPVRLGPHPPQFDALTPDTDLAGGLLGGAAPTLAATPGATTRRWWHGGGYPVTQQSAGEQQPDRAGTGYPDDRRERRAARPEGQRSPSGAHRASREHRRGGHPIGRAEGGLGAQRRGGADAGEPVARQPSPPAEQADGEQSGASDQQQHPEQRGRRHGGQDTGGITSAAQHAVGVSARVARASLQSCGTRG